jgi:hypothetical protein
MSVLVVTLYELGSAGKTVKILPKNAFKHLHRVYKVAGDPFQPVGRNSRC